MPRHLYICETCQAEVEVTRTFHDADSLPLLEEEPKPCTDDKQHAWKKSFAGSNTSWVRGDRWNYRKGFP